MFLRKFPLYIPPSPVRVAWQIAMQANFHLSLPLPLPPPSDTCGSEQSYHTLLLYNKEDLYNTMGMISLERLGKPGLSPLMSRHRDLERERHSATATTHLHKHMPSYSIYTHFLLISLAHLTLRLPHGVRRINEFSKNNLVRRPGVTHVILFAPSLLKVKLERLLTIFLLHSNIGYIYSETQ